VIEVVPIDTVELGDRSYVVHDGSVAIAVDPQRDIDRVLAVLSTHGLSLLAVAETHIHNDYVSGGLALAAATGAEYIVGAGDHLDFDATRMQGGDTRTFGELTLEALATPGHTDTHLAYAVRDGSGGAVLFTGGSLLYGSVGRTDLVDAARTADLARSQYESVHRLAATLDDATLIYPTHGFGSFCSTAATTSVAASTIGEERKENSAFTATSRDEFVAELVASLTAYPRYYAHMGVHNRSGAPPADLRPPERATATMLADAIQAGEWVVDLRTRTAYAAEHVDGTIGIELGRQFSTYLGWLIPWGKPLTLIGDTASQVAVAQRQLIHIGIDELRGAAVWPIDSVGGPIRTQSYHRMDFATAVDALPPAATVLDVRRDDERRKLGAVRRSIHMPLHELSERLDELPDDELWVHCTSGFRAAIAASLLQRGGRTHVMLIDDDFANAQRLGLTEGAPPQQA
jgi:hydroxyacylglutathione hydrolase